MSILVTGAQGQLGSAFRRLAENQADKKFFFFDRTTLDITQPEQLRQALETTGARYLVNCAAYTAVDKAENEMEQALAINCTGAANLAAACRQAGVRLFHISTDYVFNGQGTRPYREDDPVDPVNAYGLSKQLGEEAVLAANSEAIIIRTSWVYSEFGANFVKTMVRLMNSRPEVGVVADQYGSPTYAPDLAAAILEIIEQEHWVPGIYHYSNEGDITWFEFAQAIKQQVGGQCLVKPLTTPEYPTPARRPAYSVMDKNKICQTFGLQLRPWQQSLKDCMLQLALDSGNPS